MLTPDQRFARCAALVVSKVIEGGFVDDPNDKGGATNFGITLATLSHFRGYACSVDDICNLQIPEADSIYRVGFWKTVDGDLLPSGVDLMAFDASVNQGPGTSARMLQRAVGATPDGVIGPATLAAVATAGAVAVISGMADERMAAYRGDDEWNRYGDGWTARVDRIKATALSWVNT